MTRGLSANNNPTVIVHYDDNGEITYHVCGERVRLLFVDERCRNDRVYEWLSRDSQAEIDAILRDDPIGSNQDIRHPAIKAGILAVIDGKPRFSLVPDGEVND